MTEEQNNQAGTSAIPQDAQPAPAASQPEQKPVTGCTGNCMACHPFQRSYCASQIGYNSQNLLASLVAKVESLQSDIASLAKLTGELYEDLKARRGAAEPELHDAPTAKKTTNKKQTI